MNNDKTNRIELSTCKSVESGFRPSKLDEKLIEDFRNLLPNCFFIETACAFLGVSRQSVYNWRKRGQREVERMAEEKTSLCRASELLYVKFFYVYVKAMATSEIRANSVIMQAGQVTWQAAAWQLERRYPERYGTHKHEIKEIAKVTVEQGKEIVRLKDEVDQLIAELKASLGEDSDEKRRK